MTPGNDDSPWPWADPTDVYILTNLCHLSHLKARAWRLLCSHDQAHDTTRPAIARTARHVAHAFEKTMSDFVQSGHCPSTEDLMELEADLQLRPGIAIELGAWRAKMQERGRGA